MRVGPLVLSCLILAACSPERPLIAKPPGKPVEVKPNKAGLVPLPCALDGAIRPVWSQYCTAQRHYVTPSARSAIFDVSAAMARRWPGVAINYTEASWPIGVRPMPPHHSHGDGRQIDISLYYETLDGKPLVSPKPRWNGFGAFEPPKSESERVKCPKNSDNAKGKDPPKDRTWRLDEGRTRDLIRIFIKDSRVRRVFIEPHLKQRLGFAQESKVRFAGCNAARHDDHVHVDFY